ncbi:MAG: NERD domain-containing protein [Oscillospiraceae bacterium]|nr:NERD domain-containing protein [Oscillospiraceae bacterium]
MKLYKNKKPNLKRLSFLFVVQIILGALPLPLFTIYVIFMQWYDPNEHPEYEELGYSLWLGIIFISVIFLSFTGYIAAARRYNILVSGERGERALERVAKKLKGDYTVFANLPIRYKHNRSEIDLLVVSRHGVLAVEVKNHSGAIIGSDNDEFWLHRKFYRGGKITETEMKNPLKQVKRQREILKNILRADGTNVWIDSILYFSGKPALKLKSETDIDIACDEDEILGLIQNYNIDNTPLTIDEYNEIVETLRNHDC